ncbi:bifunctional phosphopantothenoylcysteine decarboxylase/phosphopantothenate--cysteine ligase CoaBC [Janibacter melonis]|uniref:Coenzyme A biosynthesis bifunctional protein CoaBC n=1 Tax=Janibacter melonis TaxID=262209 RepID=A0A5P8FKI4_9MICO|nr:bifunctional phosphopantothenoylcysteine decarboxylase/phosphopantothenate--cysteine ligase CoaBC [Janibacter melonis]QFQ30047.1 bifunctional phosphopantothenoylcysteine decarboxylase/phosphopantothenate--cysteine ligase CoaBC [Janibacter melonis]
MRVVLGVTGGIAAYKAALLLRLLTESGHEVTVVPTEAALRFVGAPTWEALSGRAVQTDVWSSITDVPHVRIGQEADLVVVAPATADLVARAAHGLAGDLLTNVLLTARCPVVMAPAMHTEMWQHAATQANVATLRERGVVVVEPDSGRLTGADTGPGRLPEPEAIHAAAMAAVEARRGDGPAQDLRGRRVLVSAGGTREALDPVRYLGNRSSGKQGVALARAAAQRGAHVTLVAASVEVPLPTAAEGVDVVRVESALELEAAVHERAPEHDAVVMAAAVADFRPASYAGSKIKKSHDGPQDDSAPRITLVRNPDVLAGLVASRAASADPTSPVVVGFAAETGDDEGSVLEHGRAKLARKGCDALVVNEVGVGVTFGQDTSTVHLLRPGHPERTVGPADKGVLAHAVLDLLLELLPAT